MNEYVDYGKSARVYIAMSLVLVILALVVAVVLSAFSLDLMAFALLTAAAIGVFGLALGLVSVVYALLANVRTSELDVIDFDALSEEEKDALLRD